MIHDSVNVIVIAAKRACTLRHTTEFKARLTQALNFSTLNSRLRTCLDDHVMAMAKLQGMQIGR